MNKFEVKQRNAEIFAEKNYYDNKAHNLEVEVLNLLRERARDTVMIDHLQVQLLEEQDNHNVTRNDREVLVNKAANQLVRINNLTKDVENLGMRNNNQAEILEEQAEKIGNQNATIIAQGKELDDRWKKYQELQKVKSKLLIEIKEYQEKLSVSSLNNTALEAELDKLRGIIH